METPGQLIDKLVTVDMKMWYAQEDFYKIRHMSFEEFLETYQSDEGMKLLWEQFQKAIDLNLQRNRIIEEIDATLIDLANASNTDKFLQRQHKTY